MYSSGTITASAGNQALIDAIYSELSANQKLVVLDYRPTVIVDMSSEAGGLVSINLESSPAQCLSITGMSSFDSTLLTQGNPSSKMLATYYNSAVELSGDLTYYIFSSETGPLEVWIVVKDNMTDAHFFVAFGVSPISPDSPPLWICSSIGTNRVSGKDFNMNLSGDTGTTLSTGVSTMPFWMNSIATMDASQYNCSFKSVIHTNDAWVYMPSSAKAINPLLNSHLTYTGQVVPISPHIDNQNGTYSLLMDCELCRYVRLESGQVDNTLSLNGSDWMCFPAFKYSAANLDTYLDSADSGTYGYAIRIDK